MGPTRAAERLELPPRLLHRKTPTAAVHRRDGAPAEPRRSWLHVSGYPAARREEGRAEVMT